MSKFLTNMENFRMVVSYKRLYPKRAGAAGIGLSAWANMAAGKNVSMDVLLKICDTLPCVFSNLVAPPGKTDNLGLSRWLDLTCPRLEILQSQYYRSFRV